MERISDIHNISVRQVRNVLYNNGLCSHPEGRNHKKRMKAPYVKSETRSYPNVLIIPDLHSPFIKDGYLEFCMEMRDKYNCTEFWFTGDILDNHFASYHETDPDGFGGLAELYQAIPQINRFHEEFPNAYVALGNHDTIPQRKSFTEGVTSKWIKTIDEVLNVPTWTFAPQFIFEGPDGDIQLCHGIARKARQRSRKDLISIVQGHYHTESYIEFSQGVNKRIFAMQLGAGVDMNAYALAYAKNGNQIHNNVGILLGRRTPIIEYM